MMVACEPALMEVCPRVGENQSNEAIIGKIPRTFSKVGWDSETPPEKIGIMPRSPATSIPRPRRQGSDHSGCMVEEEAKRMPEIEIIAEEICTESATIDQFNQRLPTKKELDSSLPYPLPIAESGIDLRPLISALLPAWKVVEDDIHWDEKSLLAEMQFEVNHEKGARLKDTNV